MCAIEAHDSLKNIIIFEIALLIFSRRDAALFLFT